MDTASLTHDERTRKFTATILQALQSAGQVRVSQVLNVSESTISRWKDGDIEKMAAALSALGLKPVPVTARCFDPRYVDALQTLAQAGLSRPSTEQLEWD